MAWTEHLYTDADALAAALTSRLENIVRGAIAKRGQAVLALAGGRTPLPAYRALASRDLDWSRVVVIPTDERCVPHDHPACNLREMRNAFAEAKSAHFIPLTVEDGDPDQSEAHARAMLLQYAADFDAVVLGMGNDAHTASLFPGAANLAAALEPIGADDACRIDPVPLPPEAPFPRITLTAARLLRARALHLAITGEGKHTVLREAQASQDVSRYPIAAILLAPGADVHIHWSE
jgi:6-phosphogluconolactonase